MPIRPEHRHFYPIDWRELSHAIRFKRAEGRCEHCGRPHGKTVAHLGDGRWFDEERGRWRDGQGRLLRKGLPDPRSIEAAEPRTDPAALDASEVKGIVLSDLRLTEVRLACAHLDQDTANNAGSNLAALCQRCHLDHDRPWNQRKRRITILLRRALGDLFTGPYPR